MLLLLSPVYNEKTEKEGDEIICHSYIVEAGLPAIQLEIFLLKFNGIWLLYPPRPLESEGSLGTGHLHFTSEVLTS
jgi:hypothetical protein